MKPPAPRRAAVAILAIALVFGSLAPAYAGDNWKPDTSRADKIKVGKSGQIYSWRKGKC
ncbi:MAG: hypothetical protein QNJ90_01335 [Planctomycetota bacterium]|nr:hypothetical protein [Planctomycetota bacterium]